MKRKFILLAALAMNLCANAQQSDPVLMRINDKNVTRSEFEYIYNKNNSNNELDKKTLEEYVDLFVNFKLKVVAAEASGLDTTKAFRDEFQGYRSQLTKSYLTDDTVDEANALNIYERLKENVEASHILIRCTATASPTDTLDAYNKAERARQRILNGEPFEKVAREASEDPSAAQNGGSLGYFTAMQMVYPFEDAAYGLKIGEVSAPVRTDFGYHVIKVTGRRPDMGQVLVTNIFKYLPQDASKEVEAKAVASMDSIYNAILNGADFAELAKTLSDDKGSAQRGGELPWISPRQIMKEFEDVAFALNKNEMSKPFRSPKGIHLVKLLDKKFMGSFEEKKGEILRTLSRQGRGNKGVEALIEKLKRAYQYQLNEASYTDFAHVSEKSLPKDSIFMSLTASLNKTLFVLDGKTYSQRQFIEFMKNHPAVPNADGKQALASLFKAFVDKSVLDYEDSKLETKYPDFGHLMQEYRDGILLFEISNRTVWDKASKDDEGLAKFFKGNKRNYAWNAPRFKGIIVHCTDQSLEKEIKKLAKKTAEEEWPSAIRKAFNNDSVSIVKVEKGLYIKGDNKYVDNLIFKEGTFEPLKDFTYTFVIGKKLKKGPETYKDVRGPVTADYQNYLETAWIQELRNNYKVEINQEALKTVNNH